MLLDTHALLWWQAGGDRLSARAAREIARAAREIARADVVPVSPVSCWEVATLLRKGRIRLDRGLPEWIRDLFDGEQVQVAPLSPEAGGSAGDLGEEFPGDLADRLLWSTASHLLVPLVSKDSAMRSYAARAGDVRVVW